MPHNFHPDPGIEFGAFKVLPRTSGGYVVVDTRRPPGKRQVGTYVFKKLKEAENAARTWFEQGHGG